MKIFTDRGMLLIPNPIKLITPDDKTLVATRLFCHNGHSLMTTRALFNGHAGIGIKIRTLDGEGMIYASPIYGDRSRVCPELELRDGEDLELCCPTCGEKLPVYAPCKCGGQLIALFPDEHADFANSVGICNRVGCYKSQVIINNELLTMATLEDMIV